MLFSTVAPERLSPTQSLPDAGARDDTAETRGSATPAPSPIRLTDPPVASAIALPRVRIGVLPGSPGPPQLTNSAPVRAPVAGIPVIPSVIFSPSGAFQSFGTSIVVHWKPSPQSDQPDAAGGGAGGAPVQAVSATASTTATTTATTVRVREGKTLTTDGPFAETREALGGYYLIEAKDLDEAIEWAARLPGSWWGSVEVRPIMEFPAA